MLLIFVGGVMNLWWLTALTVFVVVEKVMVGWRRGTWVAGVVLVAVGVWILG